jgi:hypothetical protein
MIQEAISPLRQRMIEDMTVRNFTSETQRTYIRAVKNLTVFLGRSPGWRRRRPCHPHRVRLRRGSVDARRRTTQSRCLFPR